MTIENHPAVERNDVAFYTVTSPSGETWTFDPEEMNLSYIESAIFCWTAWRDYVRDITEAE